MTLTVNQVKTEASDRVRVQPKEIVKFMASPFPFASPLKIFSFDGVVVQGRQRNLPKSVMHVQSCFFAW